MSLIERGKRALDTPNPRFDFIKFAAATAKAVRGGVKLGTGAGLATTGIMAFVAVPAVASMVVGAAVGVIGFAVPFTIAYLEYRKGAQSRWAADRGSATNTELRTRTAVGNDAGKLAAQGLRTGKSRAESEQIIDGVRRWRNGQPPPSNPLGKDAWELMLNLEAGRQYAVADGFASEVLTPSLAAGAGAPPTGGLAAGATVGGSGVASLRQALRSLVLETQPIFGSLMTSHEILEHLRDQFLQELESSNSGRDVLDAISAAMSGLVEASQRVSSAVSLTEIYGETLTG